MNIDEFSSFLMNTDEIATSRIDYETNFLSILENFFIKCFYLFWKDHFWRL